MTSARVVLVAVCLLFSGALAQIMLDTVPELHFTAGHMANSRRTPPELQLQCVAGPCTDQYMPREMTCRNLGRAPGGDISWSCVAVVPEEVRVGATTVSCEGWSGPDDVWTTPGSCVVYYSLQWSNSVLLEDIPELVFAADHVTVGRRHAPRQQLQCVGGSYGCHDSFVPSVHCKNTGKWGHKVSWQCHPHQPLPTGTRLGWWDIKCEGSTGDDDPYILLGSCFLQYKLDHVPQPRQATAGADGSSADDAGFSGFALFMAFVALAVGALIFARCTGGGGDARAVDSRIHGTDSPPPSYAHHASHHGPRRPSSTSTSTTAGGSTDTAGGPTSRVASAPSSSSSSSDSSHGVQTGASTPSSTDNHRATVSGSVAGTHRR